jgi:hypothetical protein
VRGTTGGAYQAFGSGTSWSWGTTLQLTPAGTTFAGQLSALSNATNQIFLYGIGVDGNLYQNYATNNTNWNGWASLGRPSNGMSLIGTPAVNGQLKVPTFGQVKVPTQRSLLLALTSS